MRTALLAVLVFCLVACSSGPYPGFKETKPGIWFRLHTLGEGAASPMTGDSALLRLRIARYGEGAGSLFSSESYFEADRARPFDASVLARMNGGDSVSVILPARLFPWAQWIGVRSKAPPDTTVLQVEIGLLDVMDGLEIAEVLYERSGKAGTDSSEKAALVAFASDPHWSRWGTSDLYFRITNAGNDTSMIRTGDFVTIKLLGAFLDGRVFDQGSADQPIAFVLGDPGQVIKGVETAVHLLRKGGAGEFIIPSSMAFGANGSSSGIVPAWTPIRYTVEVVDVLPATGPVQ